MRQQKSNKGFTLIELLIVIAIIGILAAVLIPNLLSARKRAYDTASQAMLREIATAAESYQIDESAYPATVAELQTTVYGIPADFGNLTVTGSGDVTEYCFAATHAASDKLYKVTPGGGIEFDAANTGC